MKMFLDTLLYHSVKHFLLNIIENNIDKYKYLKHPDLLT